MTIDRETRKYRVLEAVIKTHIESASPVGSKHIAHLLDLSSATIRNVMFELEMDGYIKQPHTSAGRIPTDLGYRRYVDYALSYKEVPQSDILPEVMLYISEKRVSEEIIEAISCALSKITNYTGIALSPSNKLYFDGTYHMLEQPEFKELELARDFLRIIEEKRELANIMSRDLETVGITIRIGRENVFEELRECAIVTATYKFRSHVSGSLGVIGPMRMKYERVVPIVEFLAEKTTEVLEGL